MLHTIIIPHRNRNLRLKWCLWSIEESERRTGITDYQVIVVDADSDVEPPMPERGHVLNAHQIGPLFNKSRMLAVGMALAPKETTVFTFLDADALVGPQWLEGVSCLGWHAPTLLFYRVRLLPAQFLSDLEQHADQAVLLYNHWLKDYSRYVISAEMHATPDQNVRGPQRPPPFGAKVLGNSQLSIRRDVLGDACWDPAYAGWGHEDKAFIRDVWRRHRGQYCGAMLTAPEFAMFHVNHPRDLSADDEWFNEEAVKKNRDLYASTQEPLACEC